MQAFNINMQALGTYQPKRLAPVLEGVDENIIIDEKNYLIVDEDGSYITNENQE